MRPARPTGPEQLAEILPHRAPMVLIDALVHCDADSAVAEKTFAPESYGADGGQVAEAALIECLAQTMAALAGQAARDAGDRPSAGVLAGVRGFAFHRPARCGRPLRLAVEIERRLGPLCRAAGRIEQDGALVAEGELTFYIGEPGS
jgi:predicted hotdog family 3-hydroxylacyl-ACP dehydratase